MRSAQSRSTKAVAVAAVVAAAGLAVAHAGVTNLTLYRITPRNYTGITNFDTGDSAGDAFFGLYEMSAPVTCNGTDGSQGASGLLCRNDPLLQIPGFNVYIRVEVEADDRFGDYNECNPRSEPPHDFECGTEHRSPQCWDKNSEHPEWAKQFADVCDPSVCTCEAIERQAVGREFPHFGATSPAGTPVQCTENFYTLTNYGNFRSSTLVNKTYNVTLADCCSMCTGMNTEDTTRCGSYTFHPNLNATAGAGQRLDNEETHGTEAIPEGPGTCSIHGKTSFSDLGPMPTVVTGYFSGLGVRAFVQKASGDVSNIMNGTWFSTQAPGRCNSSTDVLGTDCFWRVREQTAQVNATCVNDAMVNKVMAQRPHCTAECPNPHDRKSECFIACLFETLVGNKTATPPVPATSKQLILDAFEAAFDPSVCAAVPDCPAPCLPPCWAVQAGDPCDPDFVGVY